MTLSEESIILMTPYRLPHHGNRSFTDATDDVLPSAVILSRSKNTFMTSYRLQYDGNGFFAGLPNDVLT